MATRAVVPFNVAEKEYPSTPSSPTQRLLHPNWRQVAELSRPERSGIVSHKFRRNSHVVEIGEHATEVSRDAVISSAFDSFEIAVFRAN
ncbi:unnamed protein product [Lasius platythorax]|uniref:Uncharacterized protein n=1 Tax=Lasius platythorax TaxID=488582 RepID=A0AAV2PB17_9HYME